MTVSSQVKQTLAALRGVQGTLRIYVAQTRNEEIKDAFTEALHETQVVIGDIEKRLRILELEEPQYRGS